MTARKIGTVSHKNDQLPEHRHVYIYRAGFSGERR